MLKKRDMVFGILSANLVLTKFENWIFFRLSGIFSWVYFFSMTMGNLTWQVSQNLFQKIFNIQHSNFVLNHLMRYQERLWLISKFTNLEYIRNSKLSWIIFDIILLKCCCLGISVKIKSAKVYLFVTLPRNELLCQLLGGHRWQWISHKMNIRHPGQLKK